MARVLSLQTAGSSRTDWHRISRVLSLLWLLIALTLASCATANERQNESAVSASTVLNWASLEVPDSPNTWLVAPNSADFPDADALAPQFEASAEDLARAWMDVVRAQPRAQVLTIANDGLSIEAQQVSALFGFVDLISARVIPLGPERSSIAVYSRSTTGYWDFGVNRSRVEAWLESLGDRVP